MKNMRDNDIIMITAVIQNIKAMIQELFKIRQFTDGKSLGSGCEKIKAVSVAGTHQRGFLHQIQFYTNGGFSLFDNLFDFYGSPGHTDQYCITY